VLDNMGLGEFFFLALLALVFFGPERLPGIGARIGRWIRSLTSYSSAFLNEWRDEALAVRDAVEQVKGIRDEIVAARQEIAGSLDTARSDVGDAVAGAVHDVRQQVQRSTQLVPEERASQQSRTAHRPALLDASDLPLGQAAEQGTGPDQGTSGEGAAIAKTQEILDSLTSKRAPPSAVRDAQPTASPVSSDRPQSTVDRPRSIVSPADVARLRNEVAAIQEEMDALRLEIARLREGVKTAAATAQSSEPDPQAVPVASGPGLL
jgi:sec-independent protein translocase protein TatB